MTWIRDHWIVLAFLAGYTAMLVHHARLGRRGTQGVADYYVGGRTIGGVAVGLSFFATYSSTNSFVGFAGQSYSYGAPWLLMAPFVVGFSLLAWVLVAPRLRRFTASLGSLTVPDFIGFRYGSTPARVLAAGVVLFASFFYLTAIFKGIGNTLEAFLHVPYWLAIVIFFFVVMTYTAVGGFISVIKTDVVQGLLMIAAALLLFRGTVAASGGLGAVFDVRALPETSHLFTWDAAMAFPVLLGILFAGSIKFVAEPRQLSRFYALKDGAAVRRGLLVSTVSFLLVYAVLVPIGLYAHRILPAGIEDTDRIVPALLTDAAIFHPALSAFMMVTLVAAAMSSIDSVLLVMASTCQRDLVGLWRPARSERHALRLTASYVALFALITTLIALDPPGEIVPLTAFSGSLYAACFLPALLFGLYWRRGNGSAVVASLLTGLVTLLVWPRIGWDGVHEVFPALLFSVLAFIVVALATPPNPSPEVDTLLAGGEVAPEAAPARAGTPV